MCFFFLFSALGEYRWVASEPGVTLSGGEEILLSSKMPIHLSLLYSYSLPNARGW